MVLILNHFSYHASTVVAPAEIDKLRKNGEISVIQSYPSWKVTLKIDVFNFLGVKNFCGGINQIDFENPTYDPNLDF